jgi:tRNA-splicing ligase RtcB
MQSLHQTIEVPGGVPIKTWTSGVPVEAEALAQLRNIARLPIVHGFVAAMPDVHLGIGATVGSVIPTRGAIIPAAVGVDIGCGMMAVETSLRATDLPDSLKGIRALIEASVPVGRASFGDLSEAGVSSWGALAPRYAQICDRHPAVKGGQTANQLGTLGSGNHFIELCLDERDHVWVMLHSGSRGVGNRIGTYFIELAKRDMEDVLGNLPHKDLAYFTEGTAHFDEYVEAVSWAQAFARANRELMMKNVIDGLRKVRTLPPFSAWLTAVNCHHNYVAEETHYGASVLVTRKGAVRAGKGELGIIPGSMGARSFIVRGLGNEDSLCSCSHGAGRAMSRTAARKRFTVADHVKATEGVECRKDEHVIDETPMAYKSIEDVMRAQADLVEVVHTLKQVVCVKG